MIPTSFPRVNANKWRAIIFDLDDTLYPERDYVLSGFRAIAAWLEKEKKVSSSESYSELKSLFDAGVRGDTFNQWLRGKRLSDELVPSLVRVYREHTPVLTPFEGAEEVLTSLQKTYRLALLSDGYLEVQKAKLKALGLERFFEVVVFSDQWGREHWKPSVRPFKTAAELLHLEPSEMVYVADNPVKDFLGARQVGIFTVRLRREGSEYAHLEPQDADYAPDAVLSSFDALRNLLACPEGETEP